MKDAGRIDAVTPGAAGAGATLYLDLVKRAVTGFLQHGGAQAFEAYAAGQAYDASGQAWTIDLASRPHTLLDRAKLDLIETCAMRLERDDVPGDYIEAGVWRGGAVIFMRALLAAHGIAGRSVIAADSFEGIPLNTKFRHDQVDRWADRWAAPLDEVHDIARRYGLLDERLIFLPGFFEESLPTLEERRFALVRLDSDAHDSVMTSLEQLYPRLSKGGIIIIDDWHLTGCRFAVNAFRERHGIADAVHVEAENGWWVKGDDFMSPPLPDLAATPS